MAAELTPAQRRMRGRFESALALAAPALDLLLAAGERISRIAEPQDTGYYPVRSRGEEALAGEALGRLERDGDGRGQGGGEATG